MRHCSSPILNPLLCCACTCAHLCVHAGACHGVYVEVKGQPQAVTLYTKLTAPELPGTLFSVSHQRRARISETCATVSALPGFCGFHLRSSDLWGKRCTHRAISPVLVLLKFLFISWCVLIILSKFCDISYMYVMHFGHIHASLSNKSPLTLSGFNQGSYQAWA